MNQESERAGAHRLHEMGWGDLACVFFPQGFMGSVLKGLWVGHCGNTKNIRPCYVLCICGNDLVCIEDINTG